MLDQNEEGLPHGRMFNFPHIPSPEIDNRPVCRGGLDVEFPE
jgi:hypothetical protein